MLNSVEALSLGGPLVEPNIHIEYNIKMLNFGTIMIGTENAKELASFYEKVFDKKPDMTDGDWAGWKMGKMFFTIGAHSEIHGKSKEPQRLILNFETSDVKKEFDRIKSIGAQVIKEPYEMQGMWLSTLADPDGNYFQLVTPWEG